MTNFIVFDHKYKEKNGVSRMVLTFSQRTLVNHVKKPIFPLEAFYLKSYVDLLTADKLPDSEMFNLIRKVVGKEDPRDLITSKGKETKRLVIILQDLEINCILFGELVDHLLPHLEEERAEPLIVVLQYFKATRWNGKTSVQSNFEISKVHINPELTEVIQFKSKLSSPAASNPTRISQVSSPNAWSALDELKHRSVAIKTIEEALNSMEEGPIWILGTIVSINAGKDDWFYKSCRRCPKKVETPIENRYECGKCGHTHGTVALRYKLEGVGEDDYPQLLDNMMDKRVLFKLNVKSGNIKQYDPVYTVMKICDDEDIIMKNMPESLPNKLAINEDDHDYSNLVDISGIVVNLTSNTDTHLTMNFTEESVSSLKFKTPAKRTISGVKIGNININLIEEEGQNSTNRLRSKGTKKLKSQLNDSDV
ncbi:uncharacterized protein LOC107607840 [Arachis ipaensis]|uniref:Replication factor A C-terminal domain-containing protein n=1 Tax=Arachis hypogaea TaxID=3818 RepID=A0A445C9N3_ARAHY|nr:uncharacterized protein LOC107607840 [Arachis ipaensis]XP_025665250.1 uncharacterized protein LOC112763923 [Arachis hypogaea]RYR47677.1 hypothetical protein Ahy_A07g033622 [Arachis hypogaea]